MLAYLNFYNNINVAPLHSKNFSDLVQRKHSKIWV